MTNTSDGEDLKHKANIETKQVTAIDGIRWVANKSDFAKPVALDTFRPSCGLAESRNDLLVGCAGLEPATDGL